MRREKIEVDWRVSFTDDCKRREATVVVAVVVAVVVQCSTESRQTRLWVGCHLPQYCHLLLCALSLTRSLVCTRHPLILPGTQERSRQARVSYSSAMTVEKLLH